MSTQETTPSQAVLRSEPLFSLWLDIAYGRRQVIGDTALGWRAVYPVDGGRFEGARLKGRVSPDGADWVTRRADGATIIDVRLGLVTDDGAAIGMTYTGLLCIDPAASERFRRNQGVDYGETYIRTTPRFETADPRYAWLNRVIAVANGGPPGDGPTYEVFEIR